MPTLTPLPKFDDVRVVAAHGVSTIEVDPDQPDKDIANMRQLFDGAIAARRAFDDQFNDLIASRNLTRDGKAERIRDLATSLLANVPGDNLIAVAEQHHAELADSIRFKPATLDVRQFEGNPSAVSAAVGRHAALAVREHEVRQWLSDPDRDGLERLQFFNEAVDKRDELVFGAFVNAPGPIRDSLLSPDEIKQGVERWEANGHPETAEKVKVLGRAIELANDARRNLVAHVRSVAGLPESFQPIVVGRG